MCNNTSCIINMEQFKVRYIKKYADFTVGKEYMFPHPIDDSGKLRNRICNFQAWEDTFEKVEEPSKGVEPRSVWTYAIFIVNYGGHPEGTVDEITESNNFVTVVTLPFKGDKNDPCCLMNNTECKCFSTKEEADSYSKQHYPELWSKAIETKPKYDTSTSITRAAFDAQKSKSIKTSSESILAVSLIGKYWKCIYTEDSRFTINAIYPVQKFINTDTAELIENNVEEYHNKNGYPFDGFFWKFKEVDINGNSIDSTSQYSLTLEECFRVNLQSSSKEKSVFISVSSVYDDLNEEEF